MLKNDTYSNSVSSLPKKYEQSVYIINKRAFFGNDILLYSRYKQKTDIHTFMQVNVIIIIYSFRQKTTYYFPHKSVCGYAVLCAKR